MLIVKKSMNRKGAIQSNHRSGNSHTSTPLLLPKSNFVKSESAGSLQMKAISKSNYNNGIYNSSNLVESEGTGIKLLAINNHQRMKSEKSQLTDKFTYVSSPLV